MIGPGAGGFEPREIGEIGKRRAGFERGEEVRKILAIESHDRRARRIFHRIEPRRGGKECFADNAADRGKACFQRRDQALHDIVAIDGETILPRGGAAFGDAFGHGQGRIEKRGGESGRIECGL